MAPVKAMNVLVYAGTGTTPASVASALSTLRRLLSPHFAISPITASAIISEPWTKNCFLLVFPGGADLPYCAAFNGAGNRRISQYVRQGGSYLGFCAGGYYGSSMVEFEVEDKRLAVVGKRELAFFNGTSRGTAFKGFEYGTEKGARAAKIKTKCTDGEKSWRCYFNGGGVFVDAKGKEKVEVLAEYEEDIEVDGGNGKAAVVFCEVGEGRVVLTGTHPEVAAAGLDKKNGGPEYAAVVDALAQDDEQRLEFMKFVLSKLGLEIPKTATTVPELTPINVTALNPADAGHLLDRLQEHVTTSDTQLSQLKDEADTFFLSKSSSPLPSLFSSDDFAHAVATGDYTPLSKSIIFHTYDHPITPAFSHHSFFSNLLSRRSLSRYSPSQFGTFILETPTTTSTNTVLEKNPTLLRSLPHGTTFTATQQIAGRGRGSNVWVSPPGCLIFSTTLRHPISLNISAPVVFIQYLLAMAIVNGVHRYNPSNPVYAKLDVKLKWPNDVYARASPNDNYSKLSGILIFSTYLGDMFHLVCGAGVNVSNPHPTVSLDSLLPPGVGPFEMERLLAVMLVEFEELYLRFTQLGGFVGSGIREEYYNMWLHAGQEVTLEEEGGVKAVVRGVTGDWGFLDVEVVEGREKGKRVELMPDGNSFDFMSGLVRRKT